MPRGKTLKGSKHSCGFPAPPDDKNPAAILRNLFINSSSADVMRSGKANMLVYISLGALLVVVVVLAMLNRGDADLRRALEENREFRVCVNGALAETVDLQALLDMQPQEFTTSLATSIAAPRETTLRGVELRFVLEALDIGISGATSVVVTGLDGYHSALTLEEVESAGTIYICFSMDGEILKTQGEGGYGPFMMVIRGSRFAQRWCKYLETVDVAMGQ